jgi:N-sulfoglucosamine sulfohydrolase
MEFDEAKTPPAVRKDTDDMSGLFMAKGTPIARSASTTFTLSAIASLLLLCPMTARSQNRSDERPSILIYVADDQFKSSVGCYGARPSRTPSIDKLAEQGARFTRCFTPSSICTPNRGVLLSGMYPLKNGAHPNHSGFYDGIKSLPNYMKEAGYRACIVGKDGIQKPSNLYTWEFRIDKSKEHVPGANEPKHDRHRKTRFNEVDDFLSREDSRPFCIFHAASLPHGPVLNELPNGLQGYDASNYYMDYELGQYLELLKKHRVEKNTIVIYLNDNEAQRDRTKFTLYETGVHIPMVVRWPERLREGGVINTMVSTVDLLPTLLEITGQDIPAELDGKSMLGVWTGKTDHLHDELFFSCTGVSVGSSKRQETPFPIRAVRTERFKYIRYLNHEVAGPKQRKAFPPEELFDLQTDPKEQRNLAESPDHRAIKEELSKKLDDWMTEMKDKGIESELKALRKYPAPGRKNAGR